MRVEGPASRILQKRRQICAASQIAHHTAAYYVNSACTLNENLKYRGAIIIQENIRISEKSVFKATTFLKFKRNAD